MRFDNAYRIARANIAERPDIGQSVVMAALLQELEARARRIDELKVDLAAERRVRQRREAKS